MRHEEGTRARKMTNELHDEISRRCLLSNRFLPFAFYLPPIEHEFHANSNFPRSFRVARIRCSIDRIMHFIIRTLERRRERFNRSMTFILDENWYNEDEWKTVGSSRAIFFFLLSNASQVAASNLIAIVAAIIAMVEVASGHFLKIAINPSAQSATNPYSSLINLNESRDKHHRFPLQISKNSYQVTYK